MNNYRDSIRISHLYRFLILLLASTVVVVAQAATYTLPMSTWSGPFSSCSFTSGTTYSCTSSVLIGSNDTVNFTQAMTLAVIGAGKDFEVGNNSILNGNGYAVTITAADDIKLGNSFVGTINFSAGDDFEAGNSTTITGNVTAVDDMKFGNSTDVTGDVTAGDKLTVGSGTINGNCTYASTNYTCTGRTVSVAAVSLTEGNSGTKTATFTVILSSASSSGAVNVNYATSNGTGTGGACGTAGVDYATTSGTATIPIGSTTATFAVSICGDTSVEVDETFTVTLSAPVGATLGTPSSATGTITNDDVCACVPKNGNLIANPDFEELCASTIIQDFGVVNGGTVKMRSGVCGWTMNGRGMETWENTTTTPASKGTVFVEIDGYSDTVDCLKQNIATTAGIGYTLKVDYRARTTSLEGLIVKWNGIEKFSTLDAPTSAWQTITVSGLTASGNDLIEFCEPSASNNSLGSWIDNVRVQTFFPDHYEVSVPSSNVACLASTVKVTACANSSSPCTSPLATPSMPTANLATSAGTLASGTLTLSTGGIATTTLSYPTAADGATATLTLSGESVPGANPRTCCIGSTCSTTDTCVVPFKTAGFVFANTATGASATLPTQTAGTSSGTTYLRAIKTSVTPTTQACESALSGAQSVNWAAQCNNPTTCSTGDLMSLSGNASTAAGSNPIASNPNTGVSSMTPVSMTFDANGSAPFSFNYADVGQVTLWVSKAAGGSLLRALAGSSNAFVVKPGGFTVSASSIKQTASPQLTNPGAADAAGNKFVKAGEAFTAKVSAVTSGGAVTPNFGRETVREGVTLAANLVAPSGGVNPLLANGVIAGSSFGGTGSATVSTLAWSEVGIITMTPSVTPKSPSLVGDYLGAGQVTGTTTGNIGRFYPDHFAVTQGTATPACSNVFSYFGQDGFATPFTLTAQTVDNSTTQNYTGSFAKLGLTNWSNFGFTSPGLPTGSALAASATSPTGPWGAGTAAVTARHKVSRPTSPTGLTTTTDVSVLATPVDSDNVTMTAALVAASTPLRYGRLRLQNAYGSERLNLPMPVEVQTWNGTSFARNTLDTCTSLTTADVRLVNPQSPVTGSNVTVASAGALVGGAGTIVLNRPNPNTPWPGIGNLDVILNLGGAATTSTCPTAYAGGALGAPSNVLDYLATDGCGTTTHTRNPAARATFGIYKGPLIYRRENY